MTSLVLGILSILGAAMCLVPPLLAVIFGHVSLSRCRRDPAVGGRGLGIAGLVLGYVTLLPGLVFGIGLMASMAIPAFVKVRSANMEKTMQNDGRAIGAAAQQYFLEKSVDHVSFNIDVATGQVSGPLAAYVKEVPQGVRVVDGTISDPNDTFSLQSPTGEVFTFDAEGGRR